MILCQYKVFNSPKKMLQKSIKKLSDGTERFHNPQIHLESKGKRDEMGTQRSGKQYWTSEEVNPPKSIKTFFFIFRSTHD